MTDIELVRGDFTTTILSKRVSLIATDPPYARKYLPLYDELGSFAHWYLHDQGWLLTILPQFAMVEAMSNVSRDGLRQWWMASMYMQEPPHARAFRKGFIVQSKPIGVWLKGKVDWNTLGYRPDTFTNAPPEEQRHPEGWEQSLSWAYYCVENYSKPGDWVCDPMMGTGTMGVACKELGRNFIGIELDHTVFEVAESRLIGT